MYFCHHETERVISWQDSSLYNLYSFVANLTYLHGNKILYYSYPKNLSQIKRAGKINPAFTYRILVCGSLYIR